MDKARKFDLQTNELLGVTLASEIPDLPTAWKKAVYFKCSNNDCDAYVYPVSRANPRENTEDRTAHFKKMPSSEHLTDCAFNFEKYATNRKKYVSEIDGVSHIRLGFPLGGAPRDVWRKGNLTVAQKNAASKDTHLLPIPNVAALAKFIDKSFESWQDKKVEAMILHYQGKAMPWKETFAYNSNYKRLLHHAIKDQKGQKSVDSEPIITVVRLTGRQDFNVEGKPRFYCVAQEFPFKGTFDRKIEPILVVDNKKVVEMIQENLNATFLISARPFVPPHLAKPYNEQLRDGTFNVLKTPVWLTINDKKQIAAVSDTHWLPSLKQQADALKAAL